MLEIGPNLLAAILAVVSLLTSIVAIYRNEQSRQLLSDQWRHIQSNSDRLTRVENGK